jgi:anti-anti-sigma factor
MSFLLETYRNGETIFVRVAGRVVLDECERFKNSCVPLIQSGVKRVAVEMSGVEFIDSAGLGVLVGLKMTANKVKAKMSIISPSQGVADILYVSKLDGIFDVVTGPPADMLREENCQPEYRSSGMAAGVPGPAPLAAAPPPVASMPPPMMAPPPAMPPRPAMSPGAPSAAPMGGAPFGQPLTPQAPAPPRSGQTPQPPTMAPRPPQGPPGAPGWNSPQQRPAPGGPGFGPPPSQPRHGGISPMGQSPSGPSPGMISPMGGGGQRQAVPSSPRVDANDPLFAPPMGDPGMGGSLEPMDGGGLETAMPSDFGFGAPSDLPSMSPMGFMEDIPLPDNMPPMLPEGDSTLDEGILGELQGGGPLPLGGTQIGAPAGAPRGGRGFGAEMPNVNGTLDEVSMTSLSFGGGFAAGIGGEGSSHAKTPKEMAEHHCSRAFEFMRQGAYEESIKEYQLALQLNPDYLPAHNNLAIVYEKKPSWHAQAIGQWERVYELSKMKGDQKHIDRAQKHLNNLRKMNNL